MNQDPDPFVREPKPSDPEVGETWKKRDVPADVLDPFSNLVVIIDVFFDADHDLEDYVKFHPKSWPGRTITRLLDVFLDIYEPYEMNGLDVAIDALENLPKRT